jgi:hypothetical protein
MNITKNQEASPVKVELGELKEVTINRNQDVEIELFYEIPNAANATTSASRIITDIGESYTQTERALTYVTISIYDDEGLLATTGELLSRSLIIGIFVFIIGFIVLLFNGKRRRQKNEIQQ